MDLLHELWFNVGHFAFIVAFMIDTLLQDQLNYNIGKHLLGGLWWPVALSQLGGAPALHWPG